MPQHRFSIGQHLVLTSGRYNIAPAGGYTVVRLLPNDSLDREYRVRHRQDGHERVLRESEMQPAPDDARR